MTKWEELDRRIQSALSKEDSELFGGGGEMSMQEMVTEAFGGRLRGWMLLVGVMTFVFTVLMFFCFYRFFTVEAMEAKIAWAFGAVFAGLVVMMQKLWWWMEMNKLNVLREVKRIELQIATLARRLAGSTDEG